MRFWCQLVLYPFILLGLAACNTLSPNDSFESQISADPYEGINRKVYAFNNTVDKAIVRPVAVGYHSIVPDPAERSISNFLSNLNEPLYIVNNLLQGKIDRALSSTYRFILNSTIGIGGLFDVADTYYGVEVANEDLGETLAAWGVKPGPYLMLPFLGPSNARDLLGFIGEVNYEQYDIISDDTSTSTALNILNVVDIRTSLLGIDRLINQQLDPYAFIKVATEEARIEELYDGSPPEKKQDFDF